MTKWAKYLTNGKHDGKEKMDEKEMVEYIELCKTVKENS